MKRVHFFLHAQSSEQRAQGHCLQIVLTSELAALVLLAPNIAYASAYEREEIEHRM